MRKGEVARAGEGEGVRGWKIEDRKEGVILLLHQT